MDMRSLGVFCDLAETLHFASVADRHHMSPSTLSRTIQRLEQDVGETLLVRDNRNVSLTTAGEAFHHYARQSLNDWQAFKLTIAEQHQQISGTVSLYCSVTASHSLLTGIISRLQNQHSAIELKLHTGDQALSIERVLEGQDDFAIAACPDKLDSRLAFKSLSVSRLVLIAPQHDCAVARQLNAMLEKQRYDWSSVPWIVPERGLVRKRLNHWLRKQHLRPSIYAQVTGNEAIASMVGLGLGVGVVPELVITNSPAFDSIAVIDLPDKQCPEFQRFDIGLCVLKRRLQEPVIEAVWSTVV